ncbi:MAG: ATP synthase F1 subunit gamma [Cyclonatronaceae bacterium]
MANLRDIRDRISSVKSTQQITRAMKMVAAARLRKAQERMTDARPYTYKLREIVARLVKKSRVENALFRKEHKPEKILLMVMGSDRGLCGGFNNNLFRIVEHRLQDEFSSHMENDNLSMICFGKKANDYFRKRKYPVIDQKIGFFEHLEFDNVAEVMNRIVTDFKNGTYDEVYVAYNEFRTVIAQRRRFQRLLPIDFESEEMPSPANKSDGKSVKEEQKEDLSDIDYLYEPDPDTILDVVLPLSVNIQVWQASLESFAAEQGARMTAMDSATENAGEIISDLELKYNQARQAAITTEISEIVSGAEALSE